MFGMVVVVVVVDVGWSPLVRSGIRRRRGANYVSFFIYNSHDQIGWVGYPTYLQLPPFEWNWHPVLVSVLYR